VRRPLLVPLVVGKLACPARLNAAAAGLLLYVNDQQSGRRFLVDSGASVSLLPSSSSAPASGPSLVSPDGSPIKCWGDQQLTLVLGGQRFSWRFLRAAVAFPILGLDFLKHFGLCLDAAAGQLLQRGGGPPLLLCRRPSGPSAAVLFPCDGQVLSSFSAGKAVPGGPKWVPSSFSTAAAAVKAPSGVSGAADPPGSVPELLQRYQDVVNPSKQLPQTSHGVEHHLQTSGPPVASTQRSSPLPRQSLRLWSGTASSVAPPAPGPRLSTW